MRIEPLRKAEPSPPKTGAEGENAEGRPGKGAGGAPPSIRPVTPIPEIPPEASTAGSVGRSATSEDLEPSAGGAVPPERPGGQPPGSKPQSGWERLVRYLTFGIWRTRPESLHWTKAFLVRHLRVFVAAGRGYLRDLGSLRAAALTLYTLLSIVPVAAVAFGIAKGFGLQWVLRDRLFQELPQHEQVLRRLISFATNLLETAGGGVVAGTGIAFLFVTVGMMLSSIEDSFNTIWKVKQARSLAHKINDYLSIMLIGPVLFIMSSSLTVFLSAGIKSLETRFTIAGLSWALAAIILQIVSLAFLCFLFAFLFKFMPNTRVRTGAAFYAAVVTGILYQVTQWFYVTFQIHVTRYNAIYGSFAALPMFLAWLQLSWMIVLFGAETACAREHADAYVAAGEPVAVSPLHRRLLSLLIVHQVVKAFAEEKEPPTARAMARRLGTPIGLVRLILAECIDAGLVTAMASPDDVDPPYHPAGPIDRYTITYVLDALERHGPHELPALPTPELESLLGTLRRFGEAIEASDADRLLRDI